ncbi:hypothetical protein PDQ77_24720 [Bacillus cereus]|nr:MULTISPECIES: hypothetical protein [Bacillus]MDA2649967.1 hypothetical protein [Bacillus cereus]MDA2649968.1 hypothetical protein [Bacillus cereus]MDA2649969.1 hypothetical protein [Bacillus cereus]MDZ4442356.1 hypothetical protein [Bacillus cereus]MDZ4442357.1 hypothetical protein [Bacillus cereus]
MEEAKLFKANLGVCAFQPELAVIGFTEGLAALTAVCGAIAIVAG